MKPLALCQMPQCHLIVFLDPMIIYVNLFLCYELFTLFRCGIVESMESLVNSNF